MTVQLGNLWIYTHISHMHVYHTYIYIYYLSMLPLSGIHQGHPRTHVCFSPFTTFLLGPMEASLAEMRLYWTEQKEAKNWPFWNGKTTVVNGVRFLLLVFFSRRRSRSALKIPGSEKSHSEASGVLILQENLLVYTQVVKLSRLFWTSLTYFGTGHKVLKRAVGCQQDRAQNS